MRSAFRFLTGALFLMVLSLFAMNAHALPPPRVLVADTCVAVPDTCCEAAPALRDTAYASFASGSVAVATCWADSTLGPSAYVLAIVDLDSPPYPPCNNPSNTNADNWLAPMYHYKAWTADSLGAIFGLTLDKFGNIFVTHTSAYEVYLGGVGDNVGIGGAGAVYRIDAVTGAVSVFAQLPNYNDPSVTPVQESFPGLGNITYDCNHNQFFVSNLEDGKIYRLIASGANNGSPAVVQPNPFDYGAPDPGISSPGWAPLGERVWGVQWHANRVYYGVWAQDASGIAGPNIIRSVALLPSGDFDPPTDRFEVTLPPVNGYPTSQPASDISFAADGRMLVGERGMVSRTQPNPHSSEDLEFKCVNGEWVSSGNIFDTGMLPVSDPASSAGGVDYDRGPCQLVWQTGDYLDCCPFLIYGLQGTRASGGGPANSILIDLNGLSDGNKTQIGDVEVPCIAAKVDTMCRDTKTASCTGGVADAYSPANGTEPAAPDAQLLMAMQSCLHGQPPRNFDERGCDRCFGHTLSCWPANCTILGATLTLRIKAEDCQNAQDSNDDSLCVYEGSTPIACFLLRDLNNAYFGTNNWLPGQDRTFTINLANVLPSNTNLLAQLVNGDFDILISDDTQVDFVKITVTYCCDQMMGGEIHGMKFNDLNHNGVKDSGEPGLPGWTITLTGPSNQTAVTDNTGSYWFTGLPAGTYTLCEITQPGWVQTTPATGCITYAVSNGQIIQNVNFGNWACKVDTSCVKPPRCIVGWWPFDEGLGTTAADIAGGANGALVGSPQWVAGVTGSALNFPTANDYVNAGISGLHNFGTGSFSMDAWIWTTDKSTKVRTIIDKRPASGTLQGYALYLSYGHLGLQIADGVGTQFTNYGTTSPTLWDGKWHHVAATICRQPGVTPRATLYVDGAVIASWSGAIVRTGSVSNGGRLLFGQQDYSPGTPFKGIIDEPELYRCCLDSAQVAALYTACDKGKCRNACYVPSVVSSCGTIATPQLTICNFTNTPQTYSWTIAGLPAGPGCTIAGPTVFAPAAGSITVPAYSWSSTFINVTIPGGMTLSDIACYEVTVVNDSTGACMKCDGKLRKGKLWIAHGDFIPVPVNVAVQRSFAIINADSLNSITVTYQLVGRSSDGDANNKVLSLNGLPPGEPVIGTLTIAPNDTGTVDYNALITEFQPFTVQEVVLSADMDGDGVPEPLAVQALITQSQGATAIDDRSNGRMLSALRVVPNPSRGSVAIHFTLARSHPVDVRIFDVTGRLVRRYTHEMAAGPQSILWDGLDAHGVSAGNGVYLIRVQSDDVWMTTKVVRTR
jgi:hypothetical protein